MSYRNIFGQANVNWIALTNGNGAGLRNVSARQYILVVRASFDHRPIGSNSKWSFEDR